MQAIETLDGSEATTVLFNETTLVTGELVDCIKNELAVAMIGASRTGELLLDFDGVKWISLSMVRCLLATIKSARAWDVQVGVRNVGYRITDEGTGLAGCAARIPKPPDDLTGRVTARRSA